jgi:hypothetical protein
MPKENINCMVMPDLHVEVGWTPNGDVQIATVHANSPARFPTEVSDDGLQMPDEPLRGWYATLDRAGINRLIRALRKARDAAFGADA